MALYELDPTKLMAHWDWSCKMAVDQVYHLGIRALVFNRQAVKVEDETTAY